MTGLSLLRHACRVWPHHSLATKAQIHNLRQKYVEKVLWLGPKYRLHPDNHAQRRQG